MKLSLGEKTITIRKWKGKDKKKFVNSLRVKNPDKKQIMDALVYDCIEEDVVLSAEEFRYVLSRIRAESLGEKFSVEFYCEECGSLFKKDFELKNTITFTYKPLKEIKVKDTTIKFGPIRNKDFYINKVSEDPDYDFMLRIESFNGDNTFTLAELEEKIDDLDLDILEEILRKYEESIFKVHDINTVKCNCGNELTYKFDSIPEFFPDAWFE